MYVYIYIYINQIIYIYIKYFFFKFFWSKLNVMRPCAFVLLFLSLSKKNVKKYSEMLQNNEKINIQTIIIKSCHNGGHFCKLFTIYVHCLGFCFVQFAFRNLISKTRRVKKKIVFFYEP